MTTTSKRKLAALGYDGDCQTGWGWTATHFECRQQGTVIASVSIGTDAAGLYRYEVRPPGRPDIGSIEGTADTLGRAIDMATIVLAEHRPITLPQGGDESGTVVTVTEDGSTVVRPV